MLEQRRLVYRGVVLTKMGWREVGRPVEKVDLEQWLVKDV